MKNGEEVYDDYLNSDGYVEDFKIQQELEVEEQKIKKLYSNKYPELGMPESALQYTKLGYPNRIEYSDDFYSNRISGRFKKYFWDELEEYGQWTVCVAYGEWSSNFGEMVYCSEGKVVSMTYYDKEGYHKVE